MNNINETPDPLQVKFPERKLQNEKAEAIRITIAVAILGLYLGSMIVAGIHQLL